VVVLTRAIEQDGLKLFLPSCLMSIFLLKPDKNAFLDLDFTVVIPCFSQFYLETKVPFKTTINCILYFSVLGKKVIIILS